MSPALAGSFFTASATCEAPEPLYKAVGVEKLQGVVQSCDRSTGEGREWSTQMWRNTATWSGPAGREPWE